MNFKGKMQRKSGITLISLVVTIIVLLILAGVTIATLTGDNGILTRASEASERTREANAREKVRLAVAGSIGTDGKINIDDLNTELSKVEGLTSGTPISSLPADVTVDGYEITIEKNGNTGVVYIPEGLEIGSTVIYAPSGTYNWQAEYYSGSSSYSDVTLDSTSSNFNISTWKVFDIDEKTGEITLVPATRTSGTVRIEGAQGYNNAVYLLNEACSNLYGNSSKGIIARSINIEDIEGKMTNEALESAYEYSNDAKYGNQVSSAFSKSNSCYPSIYSKETLSVIDGNLNDSGIGNSEQSSLIAPTDDGAINGRLQAEISIQPYQMYWYKNNEEMQIAFQKDEKNYYSLIMPEGASTTYWIASRSIQVVSNTSSYGVRVVYNGEISACNVDYSTTAYYPNGNSLGLFPVVSLNSELITTDADGNFLVK